ncbi:hypothetical protein ACFW95_23115 [Streptomyces sp. NPDC059474]|uniref:hypothetical protein n=2 Tax=Streptomyces TaxID=1883 RepID=UPI00369A13A5
MDARLTRPGPTPPPRKLHLIYRLHVTPEVRRTLATREFGELPGGGQEIGHVRWTDYHESAGSPGRRTASVTESSGAVSRNWASVAYG